MTSTRTLAAATARPGQPAVRVNDNRNNASLPRAGD
jgi:hypothetical protein